MEEKYRQEAQKRVRHVKRFYHMLYTWLILSVFFSAINFFTSMEYFWAIFPILGVGLGVAFSGLKAFGYRAMGGDWEEGLYRKELERLHRENDTHQPSSSHKKLTEPSEEELELKELEELKRKWEDQDFV